MSVGVGEMVAAELEEQEREQTAVKMAERRAAFEEQVPEVASPVGVGGGRASHVEVLQAAAGSAALRLDEAGAALADRKAKSAAKLAERRSGLEVQVPKVASPVGVGGGRASHV